MFQVTDSRFISKASFISSHNDDDPWRQEPVRGHEDPRPRGGEEAGVHGGLGPVAEVRGAHALGDGGAVGVHLVVAADLALEIISNSHLVCHMRQCGIEFGALIIWGYHLITLIFCCFLCLVLAKIKMNLHWGN